MLPLFLFFSSGFLFGVLTVLIYNIKQKKQLSINFTPPAEWNEPVLDGDDYNPEQSVRVIDKELITDDTIASDSRSVRYL